MRIAPLGVLGTFLSPPELFKLACIDAGLTHPNGICRAANGLFATAIAFSIRTGGGADATYEYALEVVRSEEVPLPVLEAVQRANECSPADFVRKQGWVLIALQNAFYQLLHARSLEEGIIASVRAGGDTDKVIKDRVPNEYLAELLAANGEAAVRAIFESHFISPKAFDILRRAPFGTDDFEAFLAERQRTLQDGIEDLLVKERLDLPPQLRELDAQVEAVELALRRTIDKDLGGDAVRLPPHVLQKIDERLGAAAKKNAALDLNYYQTLGGRLEYADLREVQDTILSKAIWPLFQGRFANKETLAKRFDQLAELRNGIRHSRTVDEVTRKEGEAALLWFQQMLKR